MKFQPDALTLRDKAPTYLIYLTPYSLLLTPYTKLNR